MPSTLPSEEDVIILIGVVSQRGKFNRPLAKMLIFDF
jgi:hypothetical protein